MSDPFKTITEAMSTQSSAKKSLCAEIFWKQSSEEYKQAIRQIAALEPEDRWRKLCKANEELVRQAEPFFIFQARLSSAKKSPLKWVLIIRRELTTFDDSAKSSVTPMVKLQSVARKDVNKLILTYEDGTTQKLVFDEENKFLELLSRYLDENQLRLNNFKLLLECLRLLKTPIPLELKLIGAVQRLFTQNDYFVLRTLVNMRMESTQKQAIGKSLVRIFAYIHMLSFYIAYVAWLYFQNPPPAPELLRGDTILTTSLAGVREIYASEYLETLLAKMVERVKVATDTEQVINAFLGVLEETPVPKVLQWVCWCIFKEASKAFPEGNGRYNAVSAFFFLRGLFPKIALLDQEDARKKLMGMSSLTNLIAKPETEKHIPRMCKFLESVTSIDITEEDVEGSVPLAAVQEAYRSLIDSLAGQADSLLKQLPDVILAGVPPMRWFVEEQIELSQSGGLEGQRKAASGRTTIQPPSMRPKPPVGRPSPPSSAPSSAHSSSGPAGKP